MASTQANTWPPLLSGGSQDELLQTQVYGKEILASALFEAGPDDEFFFPVDGVLTGFAYDGKLYQNGAEVPAVDPASWFSEEPGPFRGTRAQFPQRGLILVTDAGLSILDLESRYAMWMIALRGDNFGLTHNFLNNISGFTPSSVSYQNGRVVVSLSPDAGSVFTAPVFIIFDLVLDRIYMERPAYRPPVIGPYAHTPVAYSVGRDITPNPCAVDLQAGGKPTNWWSYPLLPAGLVLDTETGEITGVPTEVRPQTAYQVVAYNPGGEGATVVVIETFQPVEIITSFAAEIMPPTAWVDTQMADGWSPDDVYTLESTDPPPTISNFVFTGVTRDPGQDGAGRPLCYLNFDMDVMGQDGIPIWIYLYVQNQTWGVQSGVYGQDPPVANHVLRSIKIAVADFADPSIDNQTFTVVGAAQTPGGLVFSPLTVTYVIPPDPGP